MSATVPVPSAQYLRRSTEHQRYSLDNQQATIACFADQHSFSVVQTYADARTGVVLGRRSGLRQLLQDVMSGNATYKAILVYDVSRWGRFQDNDEGAHYEFVCKAAGIPVHYCAESFTNDGSTSSSIMKALRRSMAGEYSRDLGVKVLAGQKRLGHLGFKQGGMPGYGLRRMLVSANREPKQPLAFGERKSIATDRVEECHPSERSLSFAVPVFSRKALEEKNWERRCQQTTWTCSIHAAQEVATRNSVMAWPSALRCERVIRERATWAAN
jgi:DNA invertase Pin-like site-specific DNA recombinase